MEDNIIKADEELIKSNKQFAQRSITIIVTAVSTYVASGLAKDFFGSDEVLKAACIGLFAVISTIVVDILFSYKLGKITFFLMLILGVIFMVSAFCIENEVLESKGTKSLLPMPISIAGAFLFYICLAFTFLLAINAYTVNWLNNVKELRIGMLLLAVSLFLAIYLSNFFKDTEYFLLFKQNVYLNIGWVFTMFHFIFTFIFVIIIGIQYSVIRCFRIT
ncbi:MAG: hypothetical protein HUU34_11520 [Saprospiraceae bacterium]|nr:hypothetical protein [Saprospiraceae bacterium]